MGNQSQSTLETLMDSPLIFGSFGSLESITQIFFNLLERMELHGTLLSVLIVHPVLIWLLMDLWLQESTWHTIFSVLFGLGIHQIQLVKKQSHKPSSSLLTLRPRITSMAKFLTQILLALPSLAFQFNFGQTISVPNSKPIY